VVEPGIVVVVCGIVVVVIVVVVVPHELQLKQILLNQDKHLGTHAGGIVVVVVCWVVVVAGF